MHDPYDGEAVPDHERAVITKIGTPITLRARAQAGVIFTERTTQFNAYIRHPDKRYQKRKFPRHYIRRFFNVGQCHCRDRGCCACIRHFREARGQRYRQRFHRGQHPSEAGAVHAADSRRARATGRVRCRRPPRGWPLRLHDRPVRGIDRQPGPEPRHLRRDPARDGRHRPDRPLPRGRQGASHRSCARRCHDHLCPDVDRPLRPHGDKGPHDRRSDAGPGRSRRPHHQLHPHLRWRHPLHRRLQPALRDFPRHR